MCRWSLPRLKSWSERLIGMLIGESKVDSDSDGLVAATEDYPLEGSSGRKDELVTSD